jgi:hypothetical protein
MLFLEFTAGEFLVRSCRSALQARIAAARRSCSKNICNDRVNIKMDLPLLSTGAFLHAESTSPSPGVSRPSVLSHTRNDAHACPCNDCGERDTCQVECRRFRFYLRTGISSDSIERCE